MLILGNSFTKMPVLSLRNGGRIARVVGHLINPHTLKIDGIWCTTAVSKKYFLLLPTEIREVTLKGVIVNDLSSLSDPDEVVRLKKIIDLHFDLLGKRVISGRMPAGKVIDYAVDRDTFMVQKLYITPSIWGKLQAERLTVDRSQIIEVSHRYVKIQDGSITSKKKALVQHQHSDYSLGSASAATTSE
jgi:hypothetical protein